MTFLGLNNASRPISPPASPISNASEASGTPSPAAPPAPGARADASGNFELTRFLARGLNTVSHHEVKNTIEFSLTATRRWQNSPQTSPDFVRLYSSYNNIVEEFQRLKAKKVWATYVHAGARDNDLQRIGKASLRLGVVVTGAALKYCAGLQVDQAQIASEWDAANKDEQQFEIFQCKLGGVMLQHDSLSKSLASSALRYQPQFPSVKEALAEIKETEQRMLRSAIRGMSANIGAFVAERIDDATQQVILRPETANRATVYADDLQTKALALGVVLDSDRQRMLRAIEDLQQTIHVLGDHSHA